MQHCIGQSHWNSVGRYCSKTEDQLSESRVPELVESQGYKCHGKFKRAQCLTHRGAQVNRPSWSTGSWRSQVKVLYLCRVPCPSQLSQKNSGGTIAWKQIIPGYGENGTKIVKGVSWTYCGQCNIWTTGTKEHITTTNIHRAILLDNPRWDNSHDDTTEAPSPPVGDIDQAGPDDSAVRGVNTKASMAADLESNSEIEGNSSYD